MAKSTISNQMADFEIKHRAVCEDDNYRGPWRVTIDDAKIDASSHRAQSGNHNHVIKIITQQTLTMAFSG